jgi:hypothetical protein
MARSTEQTANILSKLSKLSFDQEYEENFRISWPQLRSLAAVPRLDKAFLESVNAALSEYGMVLIPLNNSLLIAREDDLNRFNLAPDRLIEGLLPNGGETTDDGNLESEDIEM